MKLKLLDGKDIDVDFWSFFKLYFLSRIVLAAVVTVLVVLLGLLTGWVA